MNDQLVHIYMTPQRAKDEWLAVDVWWPAVPRAGDVVQVPGSDGIQLTIDYVVWHADIGVDGKELAQCAASLRFKP